MAGHTPQPTDELLGALPAAALRRLAANPAPFDLEMRQAFFTMTCLSLAFCATRAVEGAVTLSLHPRPDQKLRRTAGALLFNRRGEVFIGQRIELAMAAWQLPQGPIRTGEEPFAATQRLLREQIGIRIVDLLTQSYGWLRYDFTSGPEDGHKSRARLQQKWFAVRFDGDGEELDLATKTQEFSAWRWVSVEELAALIVPFKHPSFAEVIRMFGRVPNA